MAKEKRKTGQEKLNRFTDKSNAFEEVESNDREEKNSVFPSNKNNKPHTRTKKR